MWQAETFDLARIDAELSWAQGLNMTTMRVFLHDKLWIHDQVGFTKRVAQFLTVAARHKIKPILVLFDSCWNPKSELGRQPEPRPGVHNSGWIQSPSLAALQDPSERQRLSQYVTGIVRAFAHDRRILAWDVWNEPDNLNSGSYFDPESKLLLVQELLPHVFDWARKGRAIQPLTSGVWAGDWSLDDKLTPIQATQLSQSDIISFHNYDDAKSFEKRIQSLQRFQRPLICTEYMARPLGSTFESILPVAKKYHVGAVNWGFVRGKTQTFIPWDSWSRPYKQDPVLWFHDIFFQDGRAYLDAEIETIRRLTRRQ